MKSQQQIIEYLQRAELNAIKSMAANKWLMFGYWAAMAVHLRKVLKTSNTRSPFRDFAELARAKLSLESETNQSVSGSVKP